MMKHRDRWQRQIGTLGGGNHFIEVCLDERDRVWVMLHSGSREVGNEIGCHFIALLACRGITCRRARSNGTRQREAREPAGAEYTYRPVR